MGRTSILSMRWLKAQDKMDQSFCKPGIWQHLMYQLLWQYFEHSALDDVVIIYTNVTCNYYVHINTMQVDTKYFICLIKRLSTMCNFFHLFPVDHGWNRIVPSTMHASWLWLLMDRWVSTRWQLCFCMPPNGHCCQLLYCI